MTRFVPVFEPLDKAADEIIAASRSGNIHVKLQIIAALADGIGYLSNAVAVMHSDLADARYGPEITEPVHQASAALRAAAQTCGNSETALGRLLNMSVGELAASQQQAPSHTELNGSH